MGLYSEFFGESKAVQVSIMTDILVSLLERGSRMVRSIVQDVFRAFCPYVDLESLNILLSVIVGDDGEDEQMESDDDDNEDDEDKAGEKEEKKEKKNGKAAKTKESDDEDEDEDEDDEDGEDAEAMNVEGDDSDDGDDNDDEVDEASMDDEQMFAIDHSISNMLRIMKEEKKNKKGLYTFFYF